MTNHSQKQEPEHQSDQIDTNSDSRPGDYYYDDSTGYERYDESEDEEDDEDE